MAIKRSSYYNDPSIGAAFESLGSLFAPPSAQDQYAYASAGAKRAEAQRLADLFASGGTPSEKAALTGVQNYGQTPQGFTYATELDDKTKRYGYDRTFEASRLNNGADNTRALEQTRLGNAKDITVSMLAPVAAGATRFVPPTIADMYSVGPTQTGVLSANEGETVVAPNGQSLVGAPKALTEEQVKGKERERLAASGLLSDPMLADLIIGKENPVPVVGPDGKTAVYSTPGAAARTGAQVPNKPSNDQMSPLARLISERDALPDGDPRRQAYDQNIQALGRGQQQSQYDKTNDEDLAKMNADITKNAMGAVVDRATLTRLASAVEDPSTAQGALGETNLQLRKLANAFGVPAGDTSEAEMVNSLGNQLALRLRDPSNGAGMPGSLSDSDRQFLTSMTVSLGNSPEANRKLVAYYLKTQQKNIALEDMRRDYVSKNGRLDENFRGVASDLVRKFYDSAGVPVAGAAPAPGAAAAPAPTATAGGPKIGDVEDGYVYKGGDRSLQSSWERVQ